jgi:hypothetical protein
LLILKSLTATPKDTNFAKSRGDLSPTFLKNLPPAAIHLIGFAQHATKIERNTSCNLPGERELGLNLGELLGRALVAKTRLGLIIRQSHTSLKRRPSMSTTNSPTKPRAKTKLTDAERHKRFVEVAKKIDASEKSADFDRAFRNVAIKKATSSHRDKEAT